MGGACSSYGGGEAYTGFWWGNLRERGHLGNPDVDGRIILRCIFRKWDVGAWNILSQLDVGSGQGQVASTYNCCNETSGSIKCGEFLD